MSTSPNSPDSTSTPHQVRVQRIPSFAEVSVERRNFQLYEQNADLPDAGNARRRVLRELGLAITRSDFTDAELKTMPWKLAGRFAARDKHPEDISRDQAESR